MLAIKNGLRGVWRSPGKALLFFFLISILTALLALGGSVYDAVAGYLADCDDYYRTIGVLEYMGQEYPDSAVYDHNLETALPGLDQRALAALPGVQSWEPSHTALGIVPGFQRTDPYLYDKNQAVLIVGNLFWEKSLGAYQGVILEYLSSFQDNAGKLIYISPGTLDGQTLEQDTTYVVTGRYVQGINFSIWFMPEPVAYQTETGRQTLPAAVPLEGPVEENALYPWSVAMANRNNSLRVQMTRDLASFYPFQQQDLLLAQGRMPTAEEYAQGAKVCLLSEGIVQAMGLELGDPVDLQLYGAMAGNLYDACLPGNDAWGQARYTLVGVFSSSIDYWDWAFIPDSPDYPTAPCPTGYTVGQFQLKNSMADQFDQAAQDLLPPGFRLTVYDQSYSLHAKPYLELLGIAKLFLALCCLVIAAVLALFGYLFVYRQREAAELMIALGSGKGHVYRYFTAGAGSIVLPAAACGGVISLVLHQVVLQFIADFAAKYQAPDLRYSNANLSIAKELAFEPSLQGWIFALACVVLLAAALASCALMTRSVLTRKKPRRKCRERAPRHLGHSSRLPGSPLKYAVLSIRRSGLRTASILLLSAVVAVFLGQLATTGDVYRKKLDALYDNTTLRGSCMDYRGRIINNLSLNPQSLQILYDADLFDTLDITSSTMRYRLAGLRQDREGKVYQIDADPIPEDLFAQRVLSEQFKNAPRIIRTSSLTHSPDFYYSEEPQITWLEGYDERCLRGWDPSICVMSTDTLQENGLFLGDIIRLLICSGTDYFYWADLLIVGGYTSQAYTNTVYLPQGSYFSTDGVTVPRGTFPRSSEEGCHAGNVPVQFLDGTTGPAFFLARDAQSLTWADQLSELFGFSWSGFIQHSWGTYCLVSHRLWEERSLDWDSTIDVTNDEGQTFSYQIAAVFQPQAGDGDLYCLPLPEDRYDYYYPNLMPKGSDFELLQPLSGFSSAIFTLSDSRSLSQVKDKLEELQMSTPHHATRNRIFVVLEDKDFTSTVRSLNRQIQYLDVQYRCLYVLTGLIGLAAAFLLSTSRKREVAVMRSLGASRFRIWGSFFSEQLLLSAGGCALGLFLWLGLGNAAPPLHWQLMGAFLLCWSIGAIAGILTLLGRRTLAALSDRE